MPSSSREMRRPKRLSGRKNRFKSAAAAVAAAAAAAATAGAVSSTATGVVSLSSAAAFIATPHRPVKRGRSPAGLLHRLPSSFVDSAGQAFAFDERLVAVQPPSGTSSSQGNVNMSTASPRLREADDSLLQGVLDWPESPKKRQRAFGEALVGFVRARDAESAFSVYDMAGELGCRRTENVFNAVLSLCEGDKVSQGLRVLADMKAAGFKPRENHYAFLLREAAGRGAFEEAFLQLQEMVEQGVKPRLRTYTPVLHGLCNKPDMALAAVVWSHMEAQGVQPTPEEYVGMIKGWAAAGELRQRVLDGSVEAYLRWLGSSGFELSPGPNVPSTEVSPAVGREGNGTGNKTSYLQTLLGAFNSNFDLRNSNGVGDGDGDGVISSPVPSSRISSASPEGVCDCCGTRLEVVGLDPPERARVRSALKHLAMEGGGSKGCQAASPPVEEAGRGGAMTDNGPSGGRGKGGGGGGGGKGRGAQVAQGGLRQFAEWLEERRRKGLHYTVVVDGCNVAYYRQNKEGGQFQIPQVDIVVQLLEASGEKALVVLPERYLRAVVPNSSRSKGVKNAASAMSAGDFEIVNGWKERSILYSCADGTDDDLFWMYFTVSSDEGVGDGGDDEREVTAGEGVDGLEGGEHQGGADGAQLDAAAGSAGEARIRCAGEKRDRGEGDGDALAGTSRLPTVVTNDEMRNHRMALLEPIPFHRWRNSQVRRFYFPAQTGAESIMPPGMYGNTSFDDSAVGKEQELEEEEEEEGEEEGGEGEEVVEEEQEEQADLGESPRCAGGDAVDRDNCPTAPPPPPIVWPSPVFTRDMQASERTWHVPIREETGEPATKWLCINLDAISGEDRSREDARREEGR